MTAGRWKRAILTIAVVMTVSVGGVFAATSDGHRMTAHLAASCTSRYPEVPCLGPLQSEYAFAGSGYGALSSVRAKFGPIKVIGHVYKKEPAPGQYEVLQSTVTVVTGRGVELAAAYELRGGNHGHYHYQRVTPNHGQITLTGVRDGSLPILLLEARRSRNAPPEHHEPSCYIREVPCLGRLEALYPFSGRNGGATGSYRVTLGAEEHTGTSPEGTPILRRSFTWRSVASVELVAAFILTVRVEHGKAVMEHGRYKWRWQRVPTGPHSGETTLTTDQSYNSGLQPYLLLEGKQM